MGIGNSDSPRVRADGNAGGNIAENKRLPESLGNEGADQGSYHDDDYVCGNSHIIEESCKGPCWLRSSPYFRILQVGIEQVVDFIQIFVQDERH